MSLLTADCHWLLAAGAAAAPAGLQWNWLYMTLPFWPLAGALFVLLTLITGSFRKLADKAVIAGVAMSALISIGLFSQINSSLPAAGPSHDAPHGVAPATEHGAASVPRDTLGHAVWTQKTLYNWISFGTDAVAKNSWIPINFFIDPLTGIMLLVVTIVSTMVVLYATGYMRDHHGHEEPGYERFFAFLGLFVFSMLMLVLAGNFVLLYLGWEAVGVCSYLLIGFYFKKPEAAAAAKKAFIVTRIGDFGFAIGIYALYHYMSGVVKPGENPLDYDVVFAAIDAGKLSTQQLTTVGLLLMCGALGKSAQFPLYTWLPDAMEGPTPVSALIHAATMVTAGVYMIARCGPIYAGAPLALDVVMVCGAIGAVLAALIAMAQYDMKRVLAYSTISQLAYMFVACGAAAPVAGIFHLYTHAFFKGLLFLCAGSVMHAMGNVIDVRQFSGLRRIMPKTFILMGIGCIALAGCPPLAGFWSKDEIIHAAYFRNPIVGILLLIAAGLTAYYTFRIFFLAFMGPLRTPKEAGDHPGEVTESMIRPLYLLALGAIVAGFVGISIAPGTGSFLGFIKPGGFFQHFLSYSTIVAGPHHEGGLWLMYVSAVIAVAGIYVAWMRYGTAPQTDPDAVALGPAFSLMHNKFYVDEIYDRIIVQPLRAFGRFFVGIDDKLINGLLWLIGAVPRVIGFIMQLFQRGALQGYALFMLAGVALLFVVWKWLEKTAVAG